jgi:cobalt-zinc-cadmium efflux system outer membrane protein
MSAFRSLLAPWAVVMLLYPPLSQAGGHAMPPPGNLPGATVRELLDWVDRRSPDLATAQSETEAAEARVQPAGALNDPIFRMEWQDIDRNHPNLVPGRVGSIKYTVLQSLPWWGKRDLRREVAEAEVNQAKGRREDVAADLHARVKVAFAQNYFALHAAGLTDEILALMRDLEKVAQIRYANGLAPQQDVIKAQVEQTALRSELINLQTERHHAETRINVLLGRPGDAPLAPPRALRPLPDASVLAAGPLAERVQRANPQLFTQEAQVAAAESTRRLVEKNRYPDVTLGLSPIQANGSLTDSWGAMLELNIPLQQETRRSQEREAAARLNAARERREAIANQVLGSLHEALAALQAAREQETLLRDSLIPQAELTFRAALAGYETGKVDFATLMDAQRQIRKARLDQLQAQVEQQVRLAEIERLAGGEL